MKKKITFILAAAWLAVLAVVCWRAGEDILGQMRGTKETHSSVTEAVQRNRNVVVLDPGHGGEDGGKTGINGAEEKVINLKIALYVRTLLEKEGLEVVMTRETDTRLGETQTEDLRERVKLVNDQNAFLTVSIHQNSYHEESVRGAQVFYYSDSAEGKKAADIMQQIMQEADPENTKQAKGNTTYFILKHTKAPVIIAECGFLSNYEEAEKLSKESWQKEMGDAIAKAIVLYREACGSEQGTMEKINVEEEGNR